MQSHINLHICTVLSVPLLPITESLVTVEYIHEQERLGLDCTDPQADLGFVSAYATRVLLS